MLTKVRGQLTSFSDSNCILGNYIDEKCNKVLDTAKAYAHVLRSYIDFLNVELAKYIGVERCRVTNYKPGKVKRMKPEDILKLLELYKEKRFYILSLCSRNAKKKTQ